MISAGRVRWEKALRSVGTVLATTPKSLGTVLPKAPPRSLSLRSFYVRSQDFL